MLPWYYTEYRFLEFRVLHGWSSLFQMLTQNFMNAIRSLFQWRQLKMDYILCHFILLNSKSNQNLCSMEAPTLPGLASPASTRSSMELTLLRKGGIWRAVSNQIPGCDRGRQPSPYVNPPSSPPAQDTRCMQELGKQFSLHNQDQAHGLPCTLQFTYSCSCNNTHPCRWSLGPSKGSTEPPILPLQHPTRRNSLLCDGGPDTTTHQWPPLVLHEPEPQRDSLPTQCSELWSNQGV